MILFAPFAERQPWLNGSLNPKSYPWAKELAQLLSKEDHVIQVGGENDEQVCEDFRKNLGFREVGKLIHESRTGVCVDSFLSHYYWYLDRRALVIFSVSDPVIYGHETNLNVLKDRKYLRENQWDLYYANQVNHEAFLSPSEVLTALQEIIKC